MYLRVTDSGIHVRFFFFFLLIALSMIQGEDNRRQTGQELLGWNGIPFYSTHSTTYTRGWNDAGMVVTRVIRVILGIRVILNALVNSIHMLGCSNP